MTPGDTSLDASIKEVSEARDKVVLKLNEKLDREIAAAKTDDAKGKLEAKKFSEYGEKIQAAKEKLAQDPDAFKAEREAHKVKVSQAAELAKSEQTLKDIEKRMPALEKELKKTPESDVLKAEKRHLEAQRARIVAEKEIAEMQKAGSSQPNVDPSKAAPPATNADSSGTSGSEKAKPLRPTDGPRDMKELERDSRMLQRILVPDRLTQLRIEAIKIEKDLLFKQAERAKLEGEIKPTNSNPKQLALNPKQSEALRQKEIKLRNLESECHGLQDKITLNRIDQVTVSQDNYKAINTRLDQLSEEIKNASGNKLLIAEKNYLDDQRVRILESQRADNYRGSDSTLKDLRSNQVRAKTTEFEKAKAYLAEADNAIKAATGPERDALVLKRNQISKSCDALEQELQGGAKSNGATGGTPKTTGDSPDNGPKKDGPKPTLDEKQKELQTLKQSEADAQTERRVASASQGFRDQ